MSEIKTGYHIRRNNPDVKVDKNDKKEKSFNYPSGLIPFIVNCILFLTILFVAIFVSNKQVHIFSGIIASMFSLAFNVFWWMGRKEFMSGIRYSLHNVAKKLRMIQLREKIDVKDIMPTKDFSESLVLYKSNNSESLLMISSNDKLVFSSWISLKREIQISISLLVIFFCGLTLLYGTKHFLI